MGMRWSLAARDSRIFCPAHAETTNIVPTAGPMRVRGCVPTRAVSGYRKGTRPVPPTTPLPPAPPGALSRRPGAPAAGQPWRPPAGCQAARMGSSWRAADHHVPCEAGRLVAPHRCSTAMWQTVPSSAAGDGLW